MKRVFSKSVRKAAAWFMALFFVVLSVYPPDSLAADGANIGLELTLVDSLESGANVLTEVPAGQKFFLKVAFNFNTSQSQAGNYLDTTMFVTVPSGVEFHRVAGSSALLEDSAPGLVNFPARGVAFDFFDSISQGEAGSIALELSFPNLVSADQLIKQFTASMNGYFGTDAVFEPVTVQADPAEIKNLARDEWVTNKVVYRGPEAVDNNTFYEVVYKLSASTVDAQDRLGRLGLSQFVLEDILPTNYPTGGGPRFVSLTDKDGVNVPTGDYSTVITNEVLEKVTINKYTQSGGTDMIPAGAPIETVYYLTVRYPFDAYIKPSNTPDDKVLTKLTNTLNMRYVLTTTNTQVEKQSTVEISLGEKEQPGNSYVIDLEKYLAIQGVNDFLNNKDSIDKGYSKAMFSLYADEACTTHPLKVDGSVFNLNEVKDVPVNDLGRVRFDQLRFGTYYIKETAPTGFATPTTDGKIKVEILSNGDVLFNGLTYVKGSAVKLVNQAKDDGMGIIMFWKLGVPAGSNVAAKMAGVKFDLWELDGNGSRVRKYASATSDASGCVRFDAVMAGEYEIEEVGLPTDPKNEYVINPTVKKVTVVGNKINYLNESDGNTSAEWPSTFVNTSPNGRFKIKKIDELNQSLTLTDAEFDLYGPYTDASLTEPPSGATVTSHIAMKGVYEYTSDPLAPGTYFLKETKAPSTYVLKPGYIKVTVTKNNTVALDVTNVKEAGLHLHKYGAIANAEGAARRIGLAGAVFNIYDSASATTPIATITTTVDATGKPNTPVVPLSPGTYWYEEKSAPEGFTPITGRHEFKLTSGASQTVEVENGTNRGRMVIKKMNRRTNDVDPKLEGTEFTIYTNYDCTEQLDPSKYTNKIIIGSDGYGYSEFLPAGKYFLKETKVPGGFYQPIEIFTNLITAPAPYDQGPSAAGGAGLGIEVPSNGIVSFMVFNDPGVKITIIKEDEEKAAGKTVYVNGAKFARYDSLADANNKTGAKETVTVANGKATFSNLQPGKTYYIREVSVPTGYILDDTVHTLTAPTNTSSGDTLEKTITNKHYGKVVVNKTGTFDGTSASLAGAEFYIYPRTSGGNASSDKTAAQGNNTYLNLDEKTASKRYERDELTPGNYWLEETKAPTGYALGTPNPREVTIKSGINYTGRDAETTTVDNPAAQGKFRLNKYRTGTTTRLKAKFVLLKSTANPDNYAPSDVVKEFETATNSAYTSEWIDPGNYILKEISVDGDYIVDPTPRTITITAGLTTTADTSAAVLTFYNAPKGYIQINKWGVWMMTTTEGGTEKISYPLADAVFNIYKRTGDDFATDKTTGNLVLENQTIPSSGSLKTVGLPAGDYWVFEVSAPAGYKLPVNEADRAYKVTVEAAKTATVDVDNESEKSRIKVFKMENGTTTLLNGAEFELYVVDDATGTSTKVSEDTEPDLYVNLTKVPDQPKFTSGTITGETGTAMTVVLEPGKQYYIRELDDANSVLYKDGYRRMREWIGPFETVAGKVTPANVYNYKPQTVPGTKTNGVTNKGVAGALIAVFAQQSDAATMNALIESRMAETPARPITKAELENPANMLAWNIVSWAESKANGALSFTGLTPGQTYYALEVGQMENYMRDDTIRAVTVNSAGSGFEGGLTIKNRPYGQIRIRKITTLSGVDYDLDGAKIEIYATEPDGSGGFRKKTNGSGTVLDPVDTIVSGTDTAGHALSKLLPPGKYILVETSAPEGFEVDPSEYLVEIADGKVNTDKVTAPFKNKALYGRFILRKLGRTSATDGNMVRLNATFKVEKKDGNGVYQEYKINNAQYTFTTDKTKDYFISVYLPVGDYRITETWVENGYTMTGATSEFAIGEGKTTNAAGPQATITPGSENPIEIVDPLKGKINIKKTGTWNSTDVKNLQGVEFKLFKNTGNKAVDIAGTAVATGTTNASGVLAFNNLDIPTWDGSKYIGKYWLVETGIGAANAAYEMNALYAAGVEVVIDETTNNTLQINVDNPAAYGKFRIKKVDANALSTGLQGAKFSIHTDAGCTSAPVGTLETNASGIATSALLPPGIYYLKETQAPAGYESLGIIGQAFEVKKNTLEDYSLNASKHIQNVKQQQLLVKKYYMDGAAKKPIEDIGFTLYKELGPDGKPTNAMGGEQFTSPDGEVLFTGLTPNTTYYLVETTVSSKYAIDTASQGGKGYWTINITNAGTLTYEVKNLRKGRIQILKQAQWTDENGTPIYTNLDGAEFTVYAYDSGKPNNKGEIVDFVTTAAGGLATTRYLDAGKYLIEETGVPTGFTQDDPTGTLYEVDLDEGETDTTFAVSRNNNASGSSILNKAVSGRFKVTKYTTGTSNKLKGARFLVEKKQPDNSWKPINPSGDSTIYIDSVDGYISGYLDAGTYRLVEVQAPDEHILDPTPTDEFTIENAKTVEVKRNGDAKIYNDMQGKITFVKKGDLNSSKDGSNVLNLTGGTYRLWKKNTSNNSFEVVAGSERTINIADDGCYWDKLDPGDYEIEEVTAPKGHSKQTARVGGITVEAGKSTVVGYPATMTNDSNAGRIVIKKVDDQGAALTGAKFEIWTDNKGVKGSKVANINDNPAAVDKSVIEVTDASGIVLSGLLPADVNGTDYWVIETQAPAGYALDSRYVTLEKKVTVKPFHYPETNVLCTDTNKVEFVNIQTSLLPGFSTGVNKSIDPARNAADKSLLIDEFKTGFTIKNFAEGENKTYMDRLTVSDSNLNMRYSTDGTGSNLVDDTLKAGDYTLDEIKIYGGRTQRNANNGVVTAIVEYQTLQQRLDNSTTWTRVPNTITIANPANVSLDETAVAATIDLSSINANIGAVRVIYQDPGVEFIAGQIDLEVTFAKRASDATRHEIRQVANYATALAEYTTVDEQGNSKPGSITRQSSEVTASVPSITKEQAQVRLEHSVKAKQALFPGDSTEVITKITNMADNTFTSPILAIDFPVDTYIDETFNGGKMYNFSTNLGQPITGPTRIVWEDVDGVIYSSNADDFVLIAGKKMKRAYFYFEEDALGNPIVMHKDDYIEITTQIYVDLNIKESNTNMTTSAFLASGETLPLCEEYPLGRSYVDYDDHDKLRDYPSIDAKMKDWTGLDGEFKYINKNAPVYVTENNKLNIYKQVKGDKNADFVRTGEVAESYPGGSIDYRIVMRNGSDRAARAVRMVDVLPTYDDTYALYFAGSSVTRATEINAAMPVTAISLDAGALENSENVRYYYTTQSWKKADRSGSNESEFPMLYNNFVDGNGNYNLADAKKLWEDAGWIEFTAGTIPPANATAVGVEVIYQAGKELEKNKDFALNLTIDAPAYDPQYMDDYNGKLIANSAATGIIRTSSTGTGISVEDMIENREVLCRVTLPKGTIGDFAFYDRNHNGIQDMVADGGEDTPIADLGVTLHIKKLTKEADGTIKEDFSTMKTTTDADGYYKFEDLNANYRKPGAADDSMDPDDYVGGAVYVYQVEFDSPVDGGVPTLRYAGDYTKDSNIDDNRMTEELVLMVTYDDVSDKLVGETNLTIDAGFRTPSALGNKVWMDLNRNGIQDLDSFQRDEPGINGVKVNLYRCDAEGNIVAEPNGGPYRTTHTHTDNGEDGIYWFENLSPGYYIVEFDASLLVNEYGYYEYMFTDAGKGAGTGVDDSDAKHAQDADQRIMRTDVIHLPYDVTDDTWDAGLLVYSALGGYCFDDMGYTDIQDLGVPLPGTRVQLFRVVNGVREDTPMRDDQIVGEDGKYFFDWLEEGEYQVYFDFPARYRSVNPHMTTDITMDSDNMMEISEDLSDGFTPIIDLPYNSVDTTWDAGARLYGTIGDYVWHDTNRNGIQDDGELPVTDHIRVVLQRRKDGGNWSFLQETRTDDNGYYLFTGLMSGPDSGYTYRVLFDFPYNTLMTITGAGNDAAKDSDAQNMYIPGLGYPTNEISIGYGEEDLTWDAGIITTSGSLGDYVWLDADRNGVQDENEQGIAGIGVVLEQDETNGAGTPSWKQIASTTTNSDGKYMFLDLHEGNYRVKFKLGDPYTVTKPNDASTNELDSDAIVELGNDWWATRPIYLEEGVNDMTWDAGVYFGNGDDTSTPGDTPTGGGSSTTPTPSGAKTGDQTNIILWVLLVAAMAGVVVFIIVRNRKQSSKQEKE